MFLEQSDFELAVICYNKVLLSLNIWQYPLRGYVQMNTWSANENTTGKILTVPFKFSFFVHPKHKVLCLVDFLMSIHIQKFIRIWSLICQILKGVYHIIRVDFNQSYVVGVFLGGEVGWWLWHYVQCVFYW
jgi:hypothetical protein